MVLLIDGNSEIDAHVWSEISFLVCLRRLFRSTAVASSEFILKKEQILITHTQRILSYCLF